MGISAAQDSAEPVAGGVSDQSNLMQEILAQMNWPDLAIFAGVLVGVILMLVVARRVIDKTENTQQFGRQLTMLGLSLVGVAAIVLALPVQASLIQALFGFIGLLFSAVIALSATTLMGNAMAGLMLRSLRNFKAGDFIRCGDHFGRVTERGLVHTEIQTEDSDLTTLPNLFLVTNPMTTVRSSGTIISATVSLGYDVSRAEIEACLIAAATKASLGEPFVQILDLGDFSVNYRVAGFSKEVKELLTLRSRLRAAMMDELHSAGIEIVSPTFMNQRRVGDPAIPSEATKPELDGQSPDRSVFDKAEAAETYEFVVAQRDELKAEIKELEKLAKSEQDQERTLRLEELAKSKERRLERFEKVIEDHEKDQEDE